MSMNKIAVIDNDLWPIDDDGPSSHPLINTSHKEEEKTTP